MCKAEATSQLQSKHLKTYCHNLVEQWAYSTVHDRGLGETVLLKIQNIFWLISEFIFPTMMPLSEHSKCDFFSVTVLRLHLFFLYHYV